MSEKSILEQALLQVQTLEEAVKQNAKGILASTMKQELNELLRETKEEQEEGQLPEEEKVVSAEEETSVEEEDANAMEEKTYEEGSDNSEKMEEDDDSEEEEEDDDSDDDDSEDSDDDSEEDDSEDNDYDSEDSDDMTSDDTDTDDHQDMGGHEDIGNDDDVMDMTNASDEEVIKVFKAMKPEDGIVVKKDGNDVSIDVDGNEYVIKLDENSAMEEGSMEEDEHGHEHESMDEDIYEIELDEEDSLEEDELNEGKYPGVKGSGPKKVSFQQPSKGFNEKKSHANPTKGTSKPKFEFKEEEEGHKEDKKEGKKIEASEAARTKSNPHGDKGGMNRAGLKSKKKYKAGSGSLNEEVENLRKQNSEYKKALVLFKEKLNEVAVFNANLAYATRLFTEHSTTRQEKLNILRRFDSVSTMNESLNLYNTIKTELETVKPVTESVVEKISNTPTSSASKEVLAESKAYENPQFKRMKDLMAKIK